MNCTQPDEFLNQAKKFFTTQLSLVKESMGISMSAPQGNIIHNQDYLNDIACHRWKKLKHVETVDKTNLAMSNYPFHLKWVNNTHLWLTIKEGAVLRKTETKIAPPIFDKNTKIQNITDRRKKLLDDIQGFDRNDLTKVEYFNPYMDDISNGRWTQLNPVKTIDKTQLVYLNVNDLGINKIDRTPLWGEINAGRKLGHVETLDKTKPFIEKGYKVKMEGNIRKDILRDIETFGSKTTLKPTGQPETQEVPLAGGIH